MGKAEKGKGEDGPLAIPSAAKKLVQSLKEVVDRPELDIYAMLQECHMDPDEAVRRLLSQDTFHKVKSKRGKKKEIGTHLSNEGGRNASVPNYGRFGSTQFSSSSDVKAPRTKPVYKKVVGGTSVPSSASYSSNLTGNNASSSDYSFAVNTEPRARTNSGVPVSSQHSLGYNSTWSGLPPGQLSMADIVRRGRPQSQTSSLQNSNTSKEDVMHPLISAPLQSEQNDSFPSESYCSWIFKDIDHELDNSAVSSDTKPAALSSPLLNLPLNKVQAFEENQAARSRVGKIEVHASDNAFQYDNNLVPSSSSHGSHKLSCTGEEDSLVHFAGNASMAVSLEAANLQQLSLQKEYLELSPTAEINPAVVMPPHCRTPSVNFSNQSCGSFGSSVDTTYSGLYGNDHKRFSSFKDVDASPSSVPPFGKEHTVVGTSHELPYSYHSSQSADGLKNIEMNKAAFFRAQINSNIQNLAPLSSARAMQNQTHLPTHNFQLIDGFTMSLGESLKLGGSLSPQMEPQRLSGTSIPPGQALPQHLPVHSHIPPSLPSNHYGDVIGPPFLHERSTHLPYAAESSGNPESTAVRNAARTRCSIPLYVDNVPAYRLPPQSGAALDSGYEDFTSAENILGNFSPVPSRLTNITMGNENIFNSQFRDSNYSMDVNQIERSTTRFHGPDLRNVSALPPITDYSTQSQYQTSWFRQSPHPTSFGHPDHSSFFHSQPNVSDRVPPPHGSPSTFRGAGASFQKPRQLR